MNITEINTLSKTWTEHLAGKSNIEFDELINISKANRRVRNSAIFLVYTNDSLCEKFEERACYDYELKKMKLEFAKALNRIKCENDSARYFAETIETKYFRNITVEFKIAEYDTSAEMAKFFNMMLNSLNLTKRDTNERKAYRQNRLKHLNLECLYN